MTSEERDIIDRESEKIIKVCSQFIGELKLEHNNRNLTKQQRTHSNAVFGLLDDYLKAVFNIFNDQKNYRIRRDLETYKFLKLDSETRRDKTEMKIECKEKMDLTEKADEASDSKVNEEKPVKRKQPTASRKSLDTDMTASNQSIEDDANLSRQQEKEANGLSPEDLQMLEIENTQMMSEFKGLSEEVQQIEKHVFDIAKLQELFTEKVRIKQVILKIFHEFTFGIRRSLFKKVTSSASITLSWERPKMFAKQTSRSVKRSKETLVFASTFSSSFSSCHSACFSSTGTTTENCFNCNLK